jgi:hypothetical protein
MPIPDKEVEPTSLEIARDNSDKQGASDLTGFLTNSFIQLIIHLFKMTVSQVYPNPCTERVLY